MRKPFLLAVALGGLALANEPSTAWLKFVGPLMLKIFALAAVFIVLSIHFGGALGFY